MDGWLRDCMCAYTHGCLCVRVWVMYVCVNVHFCTFAHVALCACFNLCAACKIICVCMCIRERMSERVRYSYLRILLYIGAVLHSCGTARHLVLCGIKFYNLHTEFTTFCGAVLTVQLFHLSEQQMSS